MGLNHFSMAQKSRSGEVLIHVVKTYTKNGGLAPLILNLGTRWSFVVILMTQTLYHGGKKPLGPMKEAAGGPQTRSGGFGGKKYLATAGNQTPDHPAHSLLLILITLSQQRKAEKTRYMN
jgi:hypothetical protein